MYIRPKRECDVYRRRSGIGCLPAGGESQYRQDNSYSNKGCDARERVGDLCVVRQNQAPLIRLSLNFGRLTKMYLRIPRARE